MTTITKYEEQQKELSHYRTLATIACKSFSKAMSVDDLLNVMLTAKDLGISPMKAVNGGFFVVNGKVGMSTALMADRIRKAGHSIKIPEWSTQKCAVLGTRKDNGDSVKFEFTMEDAQSAGLLGSPVWKKFPKQMLYNRAMSTLARVLFPDVVGCAYSEDEKYDILEVPAERRPCEDPDVIQIAAPEPSTQTLIVSDASLVKEPTLETLKAELSRDGVDAEPLPKYLEKVAKDKGKEIGELVYSALNPLIFPKFKAKYREFLQSLPESAPQTPEA